MPEERKIDRERGAKREKDSRRCGHPCRRRRGKPAPPPRHRHRAASSPPPLTSPAAAVSCSIAATRGPPPIRSEREETRTEEETGSHRHCGCTPGASRCLCHLKPRCRRRETLPPPSPEFLLAAVA
ncbi:uncharacterized protein DS421_16g558820 [Arachis hypogaea]|nr:uncharacterized protein LOC112697515 [Arachis hypogaea]QHN87870.1 uncharacterized protein DS421_16g558820 [Arachis hypogaea]